MRRSTRRAAQLATFVLAGAGALAAGTSTASAGTLTLSGSSRSAALGASQVADLSKVVLTDAVRPPIWCCGNLGPLVDVFDDPVAPELDMGGITQGFGG